MICTPASRVGGTEAVAKRRLKHERAIGVVRKVQSVSGCSAVTWLVRSWHQVCLKPARCSGHTSTKLGRSGQSQSMPMHSTKQQRLRGDMMASETQDCAAACSKRHPEQHVVVYSMRGAEAGWEALSVQWHAAAGRQMLLSLPWAHVPGVLRCAAILASPSLEVLASRLPSAAVRVLHGAVGAARVPGLQAAAGAAADTDNSRGQHHCGPGGHAGAAAYWGEYQQQYPIADSSSPPIADSSSPPLQTAAGHDMLPHGYCRCCPSCPS